MSYLRPGSAKEYLLADWAYLAVLFQLHVHLQAQVLVGLPLPAW